MLLREPAIELSTLRVSFDSAFIKTFKFKFAKRDGSSL